MYIKAVTPQPDATDSIVWTVDVRLDSHGSDRLLYLHGWQGVIALLHEPVSAHSSAAQKPMTLEAIWQEEPQQLRMFANRSYPMRFRTALPSDALDRIERFRACGSLHARIEGRFRVLTLGPGSLQNEERYSWLLEAHTDDRRGIIEEVRGESKDIRELWIEKVLPVLGRPNRILLEAQLPQLESDLPLASEAADCLKLAQRNFHQGLFDGCAHETYKAIENLIMLNDKATYEKTVVDAVRDQLRGLKRLTNEPRHPQGEAPASRVQMNRTLALHLLTSTQSVMAVVLSGQPA